MLPRDEKSMSFAPKSMSFAPIFEKIQSKVTLLSLSCHSPVTLCHPPVTLCHPPVTLCHP